MNKPSAVFLDRASLAPADLDFSVLQQVADWQWFEKAVFASAEVQLALNTAEIIVSNKVPVDRQMIEHSRQLKLICVAATGFNNVDIDAAHRAGVTVCNVRSYATASVVQHVFSLLLTLNRKLIHYKKSVNNGAWSDSEFFCYFGDPLSDLGGKTMGIIGYGELGRSVAKLADCFGINVLVARSHDEAQDQTDRVELPELLSAADVVSLHCPLTEHNRHMIAESEFALMKPQAILINTARGGLVDEAALHTALLDKRIAAAGLDVLEQEPPDKNHPLINYQKDNLIITPHVAWASQQSRQRLLVALADNITAYVQGAPRNIVEGSSGILESV